VDVQMIPTLLASGIILYGIIQLIAALIAVFLAVKWKKSEFLVGLSFLLLYAIVNMIDVFFFTIVHGVFLDVAQFGFILLAIIFFIIGMHPTWAPKMGLGMRQRNTEKKSSNSESLISIVKKI
jgi:hypothetical protein